MKSKKSSPKRLPKRTDPGVNKEAELLVAKKRIEELENSLASREEELDLLKKAQRFFEQKKK